MRKLLPIAALFVFGADAQAQQATEPATSLQTPVLEAKLAPTSTQVNVQTAAPTEVKPINTTEQRAKAESKKNADSETSAVRQTVIPRGFWWLVGAVVVGGIILSIIL
jgi:hypothetical protein